MIKVMYSEKRMFSPFLSLLIAGFLLVILVIAGKEVYHDDPDFIGWYILLASISMASISFVFFIRVEYKITSGGIEYTVFPLPRKTIHLKPEDINLDLKELKGMMRFGTQGLTNLGRKKYLLTSRYNLEIKHKKGTTLIGTKNPAELGKALNKYYKLHHIKKTIRLNDEILYGKSW